MATKYDDLVNIRPFRIGDIVRSDDDPDNCAVIWTWRNWLWLDPSTIAMPRRSRAEPMTTIWSDWVTTVTDWVTNCNAPPGLLGQTYVTFQRNISARTFNDKHGFRPLRFAAGENEEGEPDVHDLWEAKDRECATSACASTLFKASINLFSSPSLIMCFDWIPSARSASLVDASRRQMAVDPRRLARRPASKFSLSRALCAPAAMVELRRGPGRNA